MLLTVAVAGAILKGFDWEEAVLLTVLFLATWSQAGLFNRPSRGESLEGPDVAVALTALALFVLVGVVSHRVSGTTFDRVMHIGYRLQAVRFLRTAGSMTFAVAAGAAYLLLRAPVRFTRPGEDDLRRALHQSASGGSAAAPIR